MGNPDPGVTEAAGYEIKITIPTEHNQLGRLLTPNLLGLTEGQANSALIAVGLVKGTVSLTSGVVTRQNKIGGSWSLFGESVDITLTS